MVASTPPGLVDAKLLGRPGRSVVIAVKFPGVESATAESQESASASRRISARVSLLFLYFPCRVSLRSMRSVVDIASRLPDRIEPRPPSVPLDRSWLALH